MKPAELQDAFEGAMQRANEQAAAAVSIFDFLRVMNETARVVRGLVEAGKIFEALCAAVNLAELAEKAMVRFGPGGATRVQRICEDLQAEIDKAIAERAAGRQQLALAPRDTASGQP